MNTKIIVWSLICIALIIGLFYVLFNFDVGSTNFVVACEQDHPLGNCTVIHEK